VYYNTGNLTTYGVVYQDQYAPLQEYYTYLRSYSAKYDTVYFMSNDQHYGARTEYNELYGVAEVVKARSPKVKVALATTLTLVFVFAVIVTVFFLFRRIKRKRIQE
jgi:ABC-type sugar transport system permease subunit